MNSIQRIIEVAFNKYAAMQKEADYVDWPYYTPAQFVQDADKYSGDELDRIIDKRELRLARQLFKDLYAGKYRGGEGLADPYPRPSDIVIRTGNGKLMTYKDWKKYIAGIDLDDTDAWYDRRPDKYYAREKGPFSLEGLPTDYRGLIKPDDQDAWLMLYKDSPHLDRIKEVIKAHNKLVEQLDELGSKSLELDKPYRDRQHEAWDKKYSITRKLSDQMQKLDLQRYGLKGKKHSQERASLRRQVDELWAKIKQMRKPYEDKEKQIEQELQEARKSNGWTELRQQRTQLEEAIAALVKEKIGK